MTFYLSCQRCGGRLRDDFESSAGICRFCRNAEQLREPNQCGQCGGLDGLHVEGECSMWRAPSLAEEMGEADDQPDDAGVEPDPELARTWRENLMDYVQKRQAE